MKLSPTKDSRGNHCCPDKSARNLLITLSLSPEFRWLGVPGEARFAFN